MPATIASKQLQINDPARTVSRSPSFRRWLWLAAGSALLFFSYGANNIALAAWLSPVFLLHFVRNEKWRVWMPVVYFIQVFAAAFTLRGMSPITGLGYYTLLAVGGLPALLPYAVDRWLARRLGGLASTLIFPTTCTVLDYAGSFGPYGSWGAAAYSQYGNLPLLQLLSVTGLWGVSFLIAWFAAVCNYLWDEGWSHGQARTAVWLCSSTITAVILLGGLRMTLFPPSSETVRIASLSSRSTKPVDDVWERLIRKQTTSAADLAAVRNWSAAVNNDLLARAEREAQGGAKIIFWGEVNAQVLKEDEAALLARGSELAARYHVYMGMALGTWNPGQPKPLENKLVLVEPNGQIAWQYYKSYPVPGIETGSLKGDARLRSLDTPFGRLSSVICLDADFPQLLRQAGRLRSDILLVPSYEFRAIDPWHTQMASFRAIEEGVNLDKQTSQGLSAAFDYQGRSLAVDDYFRSTDHAMVAQVPTKGVRTIYSLLGDWFAWVCLVALLLVALRALRRSHVQYQR